MGAMEPQVPKSKCLRTDQDTAQFQIPTSGASGEWGLRCKWHIPVSFLDLSSRRPSFLTIFPADGLINVTTDTSQVLTSRMLASSLLKTSLWITNVLLFYCLISLTCAIYIFLNLATVLPLNSLFWMNTDFVTWSQLYNEMQTMKRLNQFTKKSICQTVWRCSQFSLGSSCGSR